MANLSPSDRSPAVKRLIKEFSEFEKAPLDNIWVCPLENNMLEWHFSIKGPDEGGFSGGKYHGRIVFPPEYPFKAPNIAFLNATGRFQVNKKICLSITAYHPEAWQPSWGVRTALIALISFLPTPADGAIGSIDMTPDERKVLAQNSRNFNCDVCKCSHKTCLNNVSAANATLAANKEADELLSSLSFTTKEPSSEPQSSSSTSLPNSSKNSNLFQPNRTLTHRVSTNSASTKAPPINAQNRTEQNHQIHANTNQRLSKLLDVALIFVLLCIAIMLIRKML